MGSVNVGEWGVEGMDGSGSGCSSIKGGKDVTRLIRTLQHCHGTMACPDRRQQLSISPQSSRASAANSHSLHHTPQTQQLKASSAQKTQIKILQSTRSPQSTGGNLSCSQSPLSGLPANDLHPS